MLNSEERYHHLLRRLNWVRPLPDGEQSSTVAGTAHSVGDAGQLPHATDPHTLGNPTAKSQEIFATRLDALRTAVEALLQQESAEGWTELDLIRQLSQLPSGPLAGSPRDTPEKLFYVHFVLFHVLYGLRGQYRAEQRYDLSIGPLCIRLNPVNIALRSRISGGSTLPLPPDRLEQYYLDINHALDTTEKEVLRMLDRFWTGSANGADRLEAAEILGCDADAAPEEIQRTYRRLVQRHHPDKGGKENRFKEIVRAFETLTR